MIAAVVVMPFSFGVSCRCTVRINMDPAAMELLERGLPETLRPSPIPPHSRAMKTNILTAS